MVKVINAAQDKKVVIDVEYRNITLHELILELKIDKSGIGAVLVNGIPKKFTDKFEDNSEVYLLPVLSGG